MAIPRELIERTGGIFAPDKEWRILLCRYNYGKNLPSKQISSTPRLPRTNHLLTDYYAKLKFKPAPEAKSEDKKLPEAADKAAEPKAEPEKKPEKAADAEKAPETE